jgi:DNA-binding MarR family transcriptional regulator
MNAIAFGTKRAFHGFLRVTRRALGSIGLTAARFDMMYALLRVDGYERHRHHEVRQSDLRRKLGVTAPVVSRMLRALEGLGLVTRTRIAHLDQRQRWVMLTARGEALIHKARRWILRGVQRFVYGPSVSASTAIRTSGSSTWINSRATSACCGATAATLRRSTIRGGIPTISLMRTTFTRTPNCARFRLGTEFTLHKPPSGNAGVAHRCA